MKRFASESWWVGTMTLLVVSNLILLYWVCVGLFGWENGYAFGEFLYYLTFFPGMFVAPLGAVLGILCAINFARVGQVTRSAALAFLSGGALLCAWICW